MPLRDDTWVKFTRAQLPPGCIPPSRGTMRKPSLAVLLIALALPAMLFARAEGKFDRTLTVSGPVTLDLTTGSGDVTVRTGGSNQVVIHAVVRSSNDWFGGDSESAVRAVESNPPVEQNGNSTRV